ncbi:MAG: hypothetical protein IKW41_04585 [Phascolarctobacterium sp.]|nr:hypothetical protein [Phascolarctobacterium sp.]
MKANELARDIKMGKYDSAERHLVLMPKKMILEMLKELHGRRKRDSIPRKRNKEKVLNP